MLTGADGQLDQNFQKPFNKLGIKYTAVEEKPGKCYALNSYISREVKEICKEKNIVFVAYSTDFVSADEKEIQYIEEAVFQLIINIFKSKVERRKIFSEI